MRVEGNCSVDVPAGGAERKGVELEHAAAQLEVRVHPIERQRFVGNAPSGEVNIGVSSVQLLQLKFASR